MATRPVTPLRVSAALQVAPSAIEFDAFERDTCYVAVLAVKNTSDRILRYRLVPPPPASPFRVLFYAQDLARTANPTVKVPPGLSVKYEVTFQVQATAADAIFHDALQIKGDDHSCVEVPLLARKACPILDVEPSLCDLGLVVLTQRAAQYVRLRNTGARPGRFHMEVLDANGGSHGGGSDGNGNAIVVTPMCGCLAPKEARNLKIEVVGKDVGVFRGIVRIRMREQPPGAVAIEDEDEDDALTFSPRDDGGGLATEKIIDVCGKVVAHNVELVLKKNGFAPVNNLYFGSLFAGECKVIETVLRNNGPQPLFFKTTLTFGGSGGNGGGNSNAGSSLASLSAEDEREVYERRKELQVYPAEGRVEPFADLVVTFTYHPRGVDLLKLKQLEAKHRQTELVQDDSSNQNFMMDGSPASLPPMVLNAFASIQCVDLQNQNLTFEVAGKAFFPKVDISPSSSMHFGDVKSHDRVDILLSLKNVSGLPIHYSIPKIAHFSVKPNAGRLDVLQSQNIIASFTPTQLGTFQSVLELTINKDVLVVPIHVKGRAAAVGDVSSKPIIGGVHALPSDFVPQYKFFLPEQAKQTKGKLTRTFHRMAPYELAALNGTAAIDEYEFEGTNNTHLTYCVKELAKRADHKVGYHEYLTACRLQREEKTRRKSATGIKNDISNARSTSNNNEGDEDNSGVPTMHDVNLGMDRQGGMEPCMVRLPKELKQQSDPLWLSQSGTNGGGSKSKSFFDENKFVKKKFKPQPATQAEIAECALNLDFDQLEQVLSGPKTMHLGKLSVNGVVKKSLTIQNNLAQNIVVALHLREEDHLEELTLHTLLKSQVVPPRTLAGFDLFQ
uniref:MSP domain-containing protein n=1 Tax=Globisporangium ultimum (strain ATCC 200006 / CBS 805.95 / DAOM BR144) TaxID=431595 RepID=K3X507_GLOUD